MLHSLTLLFSLQLHVSDFADSSFQSVAFFFSFFLSWQRVAPDRMVVSLSLFTFPRLVMLSSVFFFVFCTKLFEWVTDENNFFLYNLGVFDSLLYFPAVLRISCLRSDAITSAHKRSFCLYTRAGGLCFKLLIIHTLHNDGYYIRNTVSALGSFKCNCNYLTAFSPLVTLG